jgi:serine/threonine protein kinase
MNALLQDHPSAPDLQAFGRGQLDPARSGAVEQHLSGCDVCSQTLLNVADDTLAGLLREAVALAEPSTPGAVAFPPSAAPAGATGEWQSGDVPDDLARHPRYRILKLLGRGGMGAVYQAEHGVMRRLVALKVIKPEYTANAPSVERFRREIRAAARLNHPNIVGAYDAEQAGDTHFLVMEYVEGVSLDQVVKAQGPLPVAEACDAVRQAALGLQHAHEHGMVHRDVKPHNLIRTPDGVVKVLDFGLAAVVEDRGERPLTGTNVVMGTPDYIAPEQAEDTHAADARSDVYSLGCTLYQLLTGRPPFHRPSTLLTILAHREEAPESVCAARPDVPAGLAAVVARMMAKMPADRFQTAAAVAAALAPFAVRGLGRAANDTEALPKPQPSPKRSKPRRRLLVAVAAAVFVGALAAAAAVYRIQTDNGELVITTESDDVEVVVKQAGKVVRIIDTKTDKQITLSLHSGDYELELKGAPDGLKLDIDKATLTRGETVLAKIERIEKPVPAAPERADDTITPLHRFRWGASQDYLQISPDGNYFLAVRPSGKGVRIFTQSGTLVFEREPAWMARFTPDSTQVVIEGGNNLHFYDLATGRQVREFDTGAQMWNFYLANIGTRLLYVTPRGGQVWDWSVGEKLCDCPETETDRYFLTPDGRHLYKSGSGSPPSRVLDASTGKEVDGSKVFGETWKRRAAKLQALGLDGSASGDERRLLATSKLRDELQLLDITTGQLLGRLHFPEAVDMERAWLSGDGRYALVGGPTDSIYIFRLPEPMPAKDKP